MYFHLVLDGENKNHHQNPRFNLGASLAPQPSQGSRRCFQVGQKGFSALAWLTTVCLAVTSPSEDRTKPWLQLSLAVPAPRWAAVRPRHAVNMAVLLLRADHKA